MLNLDQNTITTEALRRLQGCTDPRFKQIMTSLTKHLHDFAREVKLTEAEWMQGLEFLTRSATTSARNSFCCPTRSACRCWWWR